MKKALAFAIISTGCMSQEPHETIDEYIPTPFIFAGREEWDGAKGQFPPGRILKSNRVIDYKGHGTGYSGHANHHYHMREVNR